MVDDKNIACLRLQYCSQPSFKLSGYNKKGQLTHNAWVAQKGVKITKDMIEEKKKWFTQFLESDESIRQED